MKSIEQRAGEGNILYKGDGALRKHAIIVLLPENEPLWDEYTIAEYEEWKAIYDPEIEHEPKPEIDIE